MLGGMRTCGDGGATCLRSPGTGEGLVAPRGTGVGSNASVGGERQPGPRQRPGNASALISLC